MASSPVHTAIIGGGIAGLAVADALLADGVPAEQLHVIDAGGLTRGSSSPCGMLHAFPGRSLEPGPHTFDKLRRSLALVDGYDRRVGGGISRELPMVRPVDHQRHGSEKKASWEAARPEYPDWFQSEWLEPEELRRDHPAISAETGAIRYRPARSVRIDRLRRALIEKLSENGVTITTDTAVTSASNKRDEWVIQYGENHSLSAVNLVWAVGDGLDDWFELPAGPRAGELLVVHPGSDAPRLDAAVSGGGYVAPVPTGLHDETRMWIAGATWFDPSDLPGRSDAAAADAIVDKTQKLVAAVRSADVSTVWRGVRFMLGHIAGPLVGQIPNLVDGYVAGAFGSKGLLRIPWAAERLSACILEGESVPASIRPSRIESRWWRPRGEGSGRITKP